MDTKYVGFGKPKVGGAIFNGPLGTKVPTDASAALDAALKELGYVSEDGIEKGIDLSTDNITAWGGDVVATAQKSKTYTFKFTLYQALAVETLKTVYNSDNVTDTDGAITVKANSEEMEASVWVFDMMVNGRADRIVVPNGRVTEIGSTKYKDDELVGYEITVTAMPGDDGDSFKEYIAAA